MPKVKVTVPATATSIGPGLDVVGLALSLHASVEMQPRADGHLNITMNGEGDDIIEMDFTNPVFKSAIRIFQHFEKAPAGLNIHIENDIPWQVGLGAETALQVGGLIAANNLIEGDLKRTDIIDIACKMRLPPTSVTAAMLGALSVCSEPEPGDIIYENLDVVPLKVVVAVPYLPDYDGNNVRLPKSVSTSDAIFNIGQTALMVEALRTGDFELLAKSIGDRIHQPQYITEIPSFEEAQQAAIESGAAALVVSGKGPALLAIAESLHDPIAEAIVDVYADYEIAVDTYIAGIDRQGITVSITE